MRLSVDHRTTYRFSAPQARLVQLLRLTPPSTHDQAVAAWRIDIDCDAKTRTHRDGFGNVTTMLYVEGPVTSLEIAVTGEVLTSPSSGVVHGAAEPLPPPVFLRQTERTVPDAAITGWAHGVGGGGGLERLNRLNVALNARFEMARSRPEPGLTAAAAFTRDRLPPRDLAHLFVTCARLLGVPARYVSGYSLDVDGHRPSPHGWAEAYVEGTGWVGFDPSTARSPEDRHVRVAVALDAAGAAAVSGSRMGEGTEALDVDVAVHRER